MHFLKKNSRGGDVYSGLESNRNLKYEKTIGVRKYNTIYGKSGFFLTNTDGKAN